MKTFSLKTQDIDRRWWVVDAAGQPLGRLASRVAQELRGKHKPTFTPHLAAGDFVVVINAEQVKLTGRKIEQKRYFRHTGYMGHEKFTPVAAMLAKHPERVIEKAVWGMLPIKNIELEVRTDNTKAKNFYIKHGFKIKGRIKEFYQDGKSAYTMIMEL